MLLRLLSSILLVSLSLPSWGRAEDAKPNVIFIISDDQAWTDYSFMGHEHIRTPNIDQLASESLTFTHGYVPSSLCRPSLATMVTGLYPHQHHITSNDPPLPRGPKFDELRQEMIAYIDRVPTVPRLLADEGYVSFQSGKWWEGNFCRCGFSEGMTHGDPSRGGRHGDEGLTIGRQGLEPIFEFIDSAREQEKPFYVWYAPFLPHSPHNPPERLLSKYTAKTDSIHIARYWAMCEWFDETVGDLLKHLDDKELRENTIVIYCCDNGWIQDPNGPGYAEKSKRSPYDGGLRTPIMVRWPGKVEPRMSEELAITTDLAPTVLAALGLEPTDAMTGVNLFDDTAVQEREIIFGEVFTHNAVDIHDPAANLQYRWAIEGDWKLLLPAKWNEPKADVELYNLKDDPFEERNLAEEHPEKVRHLTDKINAWWPAKKGAS